LAAYHTQQYGLDIFAASPPNGQHTQPLFQPHKPSKLATSRAFDGELHQPAAGVLPHVHPNFAHRTRGCWAFNNQEPMHAALPTALLPERGQQILAVVVVHASLRC
jgi:hypothetical protein